MRKNSVPLFSSRYLQLDRAKRTGNHAEDYAAESAYLRHRPNGGAHVAETFRECTVEGTHALHEVMQVLSLFAFPPPCSKAHTLSLSPQTQTEWLKHNICITSAQYLAPIHVGADPEHKNGWHADAQMGKQTEFVDTVMLRSAMGTGKSKVMADFVESLLAANGPFRRGSSAPIVFVVSRVSHGLQLMKYLRSEKGIDVGWYQDCKDGSLLTDYPVCIVQLDSLSASIEAATLRKTREARPEHAMSVALKNYGRWAEEEVGDGNCPIANLELLEFLVAEHNAYTEARGATLRPLAVILDEPTPLLQHLFAATLRHNNRQQAAHAALANLVRNAKYVVAGEAGMGDMAVSWILDHRTRDSTRLVWNARHGTQKSVVEIKDPETFIGAMISDVRDGKCIYFASDSKARAQALHKEILGALADQAEDVELEQTETDPDNGENSLSELTVRPTVLYDGSMSKELRSELVDVNTHWGRTNKAVGASPTIMHGTSFERPKHFHAQYLQFEQCSISGEDAFQMVNRVRDTQTRRVYVNFIAKDAAPAKANKKRPAAATDDDDELDADGPTDHGPGAGEAGMYGDEDSRDVPRPTRRRLALDIGKKAVSDYARLNHMLEERLDVQGHNHAAVRRLITAVYAFRGLLSNDTLATFPRPLDPTGGDGQVYEAGGTSSSAARMRLAPLYENPLGRLAVQYMSGRIFGALRFRAVFRDHATNEGFRLVDDYVPAHGARAANRRITHAMRVAERERLGQRPDVSDSDGEDELGEPLREARPFGHLAQRVKGRDLEEVLGAEHLAIEGNAGEVQRLETKRREGAITAAEELQLRKFRLGQALGIKLWWGKEVPRQAATMVGEDEVKDFKQLFLMRNNDDTAHIGNFLRLLIGASAGYATARRSGGLTSFVQAGDSPELRIDLFSRLLYTCGFRTALPHRECVVFKGMTSDDLAPEPIREVLDVLIANAPLRPGSVPYLPWMADEEKRPSLLMAFELEPTYAPVMHAANGKDQFAGDGTYKLKHVGMLVKRLSERLFHAAIKYKGIQARDAKGKRKSRTAATFRMSGDSKAFESLVEILYASQKNSVLLPQYGISVQDMPDMRDLASTNGEFRLSEWTGLQKPEAQARTHPKGAKGGFRPWGRSCQSG